MQQVIRFTLTLFLTASLSATIAVAAPAKKSEYKRVDTNFYWKGDVLKVYPNAVILTQGQYTQKGDSYFTDPKAKAPNEVYIMVENDWIEPITPPTMPTSLGVAPDAMQIREPQGDVTVALPSAPANFVPATDSMAIPNGTVVKTGANGTAAVLMGGVNSVRLIPNSAAAVQQTVTPDMRTTEIDVTAGAVFSKVGKRVGEKQDYQVKTPFGVAAARGTDFVTIAMPARTDVWIAQGTVQLDQPDGKMVGSVSSEGTGALKIIRFPAMPDPHAAMMASAQTMTAAMDFIPTVNVYVKALHDKMSQGIKLTATERDYLNRIKKVPCLIKLALVEPPAPPVPPAPAPVPAPAPATTATPPTPATTPEAPAAAPAAPKPAASKLPVHIKIADGGAIDLNGVAITADTQLIASLAGLPPSQPVVVIASDKVPKQQLQKVLGICKDSKLTNVKRVKTAPPEAAAEPPTQAATEPAASKPAAPATPAKPATPPPVMAPINLDLRPDARVDFQGATLTVDELKPKLLEMGKATPKQPIIVNGQENVKPAELKKITTMLHSAKLTEVTITKPATPPPAPAKPEPAPEVAAKPAPAPPAAPLPPIDLGVLANGNVEFQGATLTLDELKPKLVELGKATPDQPIVIKKKEKLEKGQLKKVVDVCRVAKLNKVTVDKTPPPAAPATPLPETAAKPDAPPATVSPPPSAPPAKPLPPAMLLPINLDLRPGGKVEIQGETFTEKDLKLKLEEMGITAPKQPLIVVPHEKVTRGDVKKIVALCYASKLTNVTVAKTDTAHSQVESVSSSNPASPSSGSSTILATASTANPDVTPSRATKPKASHVSPPAPISAGPNFTVP